MKIHPTAVIHPGAELAEGVEVQPYAVIGPRVRIGADTVVGPHAVIDGDTVIGERNRLYSGAQVGVLTQDLKHKAHLDGRTVVGDDNIIREFVTISASTRLSEDDENVTRIGNHCMVMAYSHVAHDCHLGSRIIMANYTGLSGHVEVEDWVIFGGEVGVHQDCRIGQHAFVGGMSRNVKDAPPYMIVEGNPARCHGPNAIGLERRGFDAAARRRIKDLYKIMYRSNLNTTQALEAIEQTLPESPERTVFVEFFRASKRGVVK
jgi:UDP-N-acetylglucosamine acyltransferase